jgi:AraC-like DNA-binding protein
MPALNRQQSDGVACSPSSDRASFVRPRFLDGVELVAASYRDRAFPTHTHEGYVIGTVLGGAEMLSVGRRAYTVTTGDVLHLHPSEPHANRSLGAERLHYRVFYLPAASLTAPESGPAAGEAGFSAPVRHDPALASTLANLHRRLSRAPDERLAQESGLAAVVDALLAISTRRAVETAGDPRVVRMLRSWIDAHFAENFGLGDLAALAELSVFRVAHLFKASTGLSPLAYRNQRRLAEARRLLLNGEPIADVALQVGFADQSHLTRHFQRIVGVSSNRYRQQ